MTAPGLTRYPSGTKSLERKEPKWESYHLCEHVLDTCFCFFEHPRGSEILKWGAYSESAVTVSCDRLRHCTNHSSVLQALGVTRPMASASEGGVRVAGRGARSQTRPHDGSRFDQPSIWEECNLNHMAEYLKPKLNEESMIRFVTALKRRGDVTKMHMGTPALYGPSWRLLDACLTAQIRLTVRNSKALRLYERTPLSHSATFWMLKGIVGESFLRPTENAFLLHCLSLFLKRRAEMSS